MTHNKIAIAAIDFMFCVVPTEFCATETANTLMVAYIEDTFILKYTKRTIEQRIIGIGNL